MFAKQTLSGLGYQSKSSLNLNIYSCIIIAKLLSPASTCLQHLSRFNVYLLQYIQMAYNLKDTEGIQQNIFTLFHGPCISGAIFISFKDMQQLGDGFFRLYLVLHNR